MLRFSRKPNWMWKGLFLVVTLAMSIAIVGCKAKPTTRTPSGTLRLLLFAAKDGNVAKMQTYCIGQAADACPQLLDAIQEMETTGKASKLDSWDPSVGPVPTGNRANAYAHLIGVNHDRFMRVSVTLVRDEQKTDRWKIDQMTWESKREE